MLDLEFRHGSSALAGRVKPSGAIALANLDHQIAQHGDDPGGDEFLLARSRFLGDYEALSRASMAAEAHSATAVELVRGLPQIVRPAVAAAAATADLGPTGPFLRSRGPRSPQPPILGRRIASRPPAHRDLREHRDLRALTALRALRTRA